MPVSPTLWDAEVGGLLEVRSWIPSLGNIVRLPSLQKYIKNKIAGHSGAHLFLATWEAEAGDHLNPGGRDCTIAL